MLLGGVDDRPQADAVALHGDQHGDVGQLQAVLAVQAGESSLGGATRLDHVHDLGEAADGVDLGAATLARGRAGGLLHGVLLLLYSGFSGMLLP